MLFSSPKILSPTVKNVEVEMSPDAVECRDHFCDAISAELGDGRKRAIHAIARATGMSERRIVGIMRGEVKRIWSDELRIVREWHSIWIERRHAQMSHELALLEARRSARKVA
jgi:hypothetical protein